MNACFLFGHADCSESIFPIIEKAIIKACARGITDFYVGNRGTFDSLAARAVKNAKKQLSEIRLYLLLAYHPEERPVTLGEGFDGSYYPLMEKTPRFLAIIKANQHMIDIAEYIICYVKHFGNTRNLLEYAQRRQGKDCSWIENVAETICQGDL